MQEVVGVFLLSESWSWGVPFRALRTMGQRHSGERRSWNGMRAGHEHSHLISVCVMRALGSELGACRAGWAGWAWWGTLPHYGGGTHEAGASTARCVRSCLTRCKPLCRPARAALRMQRRGCTFISTARAQQARDGSSRADSAVFRVPRIFLSARARRRMLSRRARGESGFARARARCTRGRACPL